MAETVDGKSGTGGISPGALKRLEAVLLAGAVGGILYWILARWTGTPLPTVFGFGIVFVLMFVGALAGAFGVYLLTVSDLNAIRTYVFAVVCGLAWQPMIAAAARLANNAAATSQTAQVGAGVAQIHAATSTGNVQQITSAVDSTASAVNLALNGTSNVSDASKKAEIVDSSKQAITELQTTATKAPDASVSALKDITLTATSSGNSSVALHAIEALHAIGNNAALSNDKGVAGKVQQSLNDVAAQAKDPSIQAAARSAASQFSH